MLHQLALPLLHRRRQSCLSLGAKRTQLHQKTLRPRRQSPTHPPTVLPSAAPGSRGHLRPNPQRERSPPYPFHHSGPSLRTSTTCFTRRCWNLRSIEDLLLERGQGAPHTGPPRRSTRPTVLVSAQWAPAPISKSTKGHLSNDIWIGLPRPTHHYDRKLEPWKSWAFPREKRTQDLGFSWLLLWRYLYCKSPKFLQIWTLKFQSLALILTWSVRTACNLECWEFVGSEYSLSKGVQLFPSIVHFPPVWQMMPVRTLSESMFRDSLFVLFNTYS